MTKSPAEAVAELREALGLAVDENGNSYNLLTVFRDDVEAILTAYEARERLLNDADEIVLAHDLGGDISDAIQAYAYGRQKLRKHRRAALSGTGPSAP